MTQDTPPKSTEDRLMAIETSLAHLQYDVEQMHQVLLALQQEFRTTHRQVGTLEGKILALESSLDGESLPHEKPPHY